MNSQLFKTLVPASILFDFLKKICYDPVNNYYIISKIAFKQAEYHNLIEIFAAIIKPYYHLSKQYYVDRKINYSRFTTIIRQLCNLNNISYTSKIIYDKSNYEIQYYIYPLPVEGV